MVAVGRGGDEAVVVRTVEKHSSSKQQMEAATRDVRLTRGSDTRLHAKVPSQDAVVVASVDIGCAEYQDID